MVQNIPPFVKKFDFRGKYGQDLKDEDAFYLALALKNVFKPRKILLGWDTRASSKNLAFNFMQALKDTDIEISYLSLVSIDFVTASARAFTFDLSIMFTGSHNPWDWTGLLMHTKGGVSIEGEVVDRIITEYKIANEIPYVKPDIDLTHYENFEPDIERVYREKLKKLLPVNEFLPKKILVDLGDGPTKALDILIQLLPQVTIDKLNNKGVYDENTPHIADPSEEKNVEQARSELLAQNYDCAFVFDSDGDRVLALDEHGNYINGSTLASGVVTVASALDISMQNVGYAVECGPSLYNTIIDINKTAQKEINIKPIPVGRSRVRSLLFNGEIDIGVENVGHFYIKDFFMTDSAVFILATILYWMTLNGNLSKLQKRHPDGNRTQGSTSKNDAENIEDIIKGEFESEFENSKEIYVDGIRLENFNGEYMQDWCTTRHSGYEPVEKYYFGSLNNQNYEKIEKIFLPLSSK